MQGRGGAGFPAGTKWGFLPPNVMPRYLVINGDESEPGTYKDRMLMEKDPHQLIEGIVIALLRVQCERTPSCTCAARWPTPRSVLQPALNDAYAAGLVGKNVCGTEFSCDITLTWGAGAYIVGEETALIECLEGNRGMPRLKPPFFPASKGLYMQPTIVNNVETLSNLPWIINHSGQAFKDTGAATSTGMRMFAISGHVEPAGRVRSAQWHHHVPNAVRSSRVLRWNPKRSEGQGVHSGWCVGNVVLRRTPRFAA